MTKMQGEHKVYSEFLTNLAVAWFSAGVIAPLFAPSVTAFKFVASLIALAFCLFSLRGAVLFTKGEK